MRLTLLMLCLPSLLAAQTVDSVHHTPVTRTSTVESTTVFSHVTPPAVHDSLYCSASACPPGTWSKTPPKPADTVPTPPKDTVRMPPPAICSGTTVTPSTWSAAASGSLAGTVYCLTAGTYPGVRINVSGKTYRSTEHAVVGQIEVYGANTTLWGLDLVGKGSGQFGVNCRASGFRLINSVVRQANKSGVGLWTQCPGAVVEGNSIYDNGTHDDSQGCLDHGIYAQGQTGTKLIRDNFVLDNKCYGIHLYSANASDGAQYTNGITVRRNIVANHPKYADILVAAHDNPAHDILVDSNFTYQSSFGNPTADLGWVNTSAKKGVNLTERWNYFVGVVQSLTKWATVSQTGNVTVSAKPKANKVVVLPNPHEAGRANVAIYNWTGAKTVAVDLSGVLKPGQTYTVQRAEDFYGPPLVAGSYSGPVSVPMAGEFTAVIVLGR